MSRALPIQGYGRSGCGVVGGMGEGGVQGAAHPGVVRAARGAVEREADGGRVEERVVGGGWVKGRALPMKESLAGGWEGKESYRCWELHGASW